jgi:hypothetical protein
MTLAQAKLQRYEGYAAIKRYPHKKYIYRICTHAWNLRTVLLLSQPMGRLVLFHLWHGLLHIVQICILVDWGLLNFDLLHRELRSRRIRLETGYFSIKTAGIGRGRGMFIGHT